MKTWLLGWSAAVMFTMASYTVLAADDLQRTSIPPVQHFSSDWHPVSHLDDARPGPGWQVKSSIQVTPEALREAYIASRDAYTRKLQKYAKCTPTEAQKAVTSAHPGMKVSQVQLRNIRTSLVYIGVAEGDEDRYLTIVDAGTGKVLLDRPLPTHHERVFADH
ncbi:hypothetical protein D2Q93_08645 [Alicyclobacillaceae bacterium I2511]|nr:hypothetical protein D2Q93_08645 [Alicyclobacillaceae bacterium I2511]